MTSHYPDLVSASDWSYWVGVLIQLIKSTTQIQIWVVTRHQYGISALVSQTSFGGKTSGSVAKYRPFSQATPLIVCIFWPLVQMFECPDIFQSFQFCFADSKISTSTHIRIQLEFARPHVPVFTLGSSASL